MALLKEAAPTTNGNTCKQKRNRRAHVKRAHRTSVFAIISSLQMHGTMRGCLTAAAAHAAVTRSPQSRRIFEYAFSIEVKSEGMEFACSTADISRSTPERRNYN